MKAYFNMFKNYINFGGHTYRRDFWQAILVNVLVCAVLWGVSVATGMANRELNPIMAGYSLVTALPLLAMIVRRLRDAGKSPFHILWGLIPILGQIVLLIKLAQPSVYTEAED